MEATVPEKFVQPDSSCLLGVARGKRVSAAVLQCWTLELRAAWVDAGCNP